MTDNTKPQAWRTGLSLSRRNLMQMVLAGAGAGLAGGLMPEAARAQATPTRGGKVTVGVVGQGARGFFAPYNLGDEATVFCNQNLVFEGLTQFENDGSVSLCLAESFAPIDGDTAHWEIRLKPGVTFHDGSPLEAKDVIHSIGKIAEDGTVANGFLGPVAGMEAVDPLTVRVRLGGPRSWFPNAMADPFSGIIPASFDQRNPIGTGPFRVAGTVETESVTLARFDGYHGKPALLDEVTLRLFADESALLNALEAKQIDIVNKLNPSLADQYEESDAFRFYNSVTGRSYPIHMRADVPPFQEVKLRQAMRLVLDRDAIVVSGYNGYATVAHDLYSPSDPNYRKDLVRVRDVAAARALVEEAGLSGTDIELTMVDDFATALILAENAKEIGLNVTVRQLEPATFFNDEFTERTFHGGDYYPPSPFFMTSSLLDGPHPGIPTLKWADAEYEALWTKGNASADPAEVTQIVHRLQEILFERGALIIAVFANELGLYRSGLGGIPDFDYSGTGIYRSLRHIGQLA